MRPRVSLESWSAVCRKQAPEFLVRGLIHNVAHLGHSANQFGILGIFPQLISQPADPCPQYLNIVAIFRSPQAGEKISIEQETPSITGKLAEQESLNSGQVFLFARDKNAMLLKIDGQVPHAEEF